MAALETWKENSLTLELEPAENGLRLWWRGKSNNREPGHFLVPILSDALKRAGDQLLVLDFTALDYMNSSTFAPIVKLLEEARRGGGLVRIEFSLTRKWQVTSFTALKAFETPDGRIKLNGR